MQKQQRPNLPEGLLIDYRITDLRQLYDIV